MSKPYTLRYYQYKEKQKPSPAPETYSKPLKIELKPVKHQFLPSLSLTTTNSSKPKLPNHSKTPILPKTKLTRQIEDHSIEYEAAIKSHLNYGTLTKSSGFSSVSKLKSFHTKRISNDRNKIWNKSLEIIDQEEKKLKGSILVLDKKQRHRKSITKSESKELKLLENSLKQINVLLKRIKMKKIR